MINEQRLADTFCVLVKTDSISKEEKNISDYLAWVLNELGAETFSDDAGLAVGGNTGNLVGKFKGTVDVPPMMLCGHMDTVEPGRGVIPVFENGVFRSQGDTILGSDDKSALAIIIEVLRVLKEDKIPHGPLDVVFTICEEIGLLGAKNFDINMIDSKFGYILDATDKKAVVTRSPYRSNFEITVSGKAAHAGAEPEKGISAVVLAAEAVASISWGRIDKETTCNVGKISGGIADNIVVEEVLITGEVRSQTKERMEAVLEQIRAAFEKTIEKGRKTFGSDSVPGFEMSVDLDFPGTNIPETHPVIQLVKDAAHTIGFDLKPTSSGGGADANIFSGMGIVTGVLGTGMTAAHTLDEHVALEDMVDTARLLLACIERHTKNPYTTY